MKCLFVAAVVIQAAFSFADELNLSVPAGFEIEIYTSQTPNARQMALSSEGILYVGSRKGDVYAVVPPEDPSEDPHVVIVNSGLEMPTGLVIMDDDLYVGALNRILRYPNIDRAYSRNPSPEVVTQDLPRERWHGLRYLSAGPDGFLYVPIGAPCNVCIRAKDRRFASVLRMNPNTGETTIYAEGVRNTVGLDWHPITRKLWFSDNGRDWLGDDQPPDEINLADTAGLHFGFPFVHAKNVVDPEFGKKSAIDDYVPPVLEIQAHSATLGITFYTGEMFPPEYDNALFIAEHGSWNRSSKVGYLVSVITFEDGKMNYSHFVTGWLVNESVSGRPNDVIMHSDGSLLISDDHSGSIYRVIYQGEANVD